MSDKSYGPMLCLAWLLPLRALRCIAHLLLPVCVLSAHPLLISRLRKVWQKRKCTISNGYLTISHSMVGTASSTLLLPGSCCPFRVCTACHCQACQWLPGAHQSPCACCLPSWAALA